MVFSIMLLWRRKSIYPTCSDFPTSSLTDNACCLLAQAIISGVACVYPSHAPPATAFKAPRSAQQSRCNLLRN
jgi:hypothetical protein